MRFEEGAPIVRVGLKESNFIETFPEMASWPPDGRIRSRERQLAAKAAQFTANK